MAKRSKKKPRNTNRAPVIIYTIAAILCLVGLADATYLTIAHLTGETVACGGSAGCSEVLGSKYARLGPVPLASVGAVGYFAAFSCAILAAFGYAKTRRFFAWIVWAMFAATLWLLFVQAVLLHSFCRFCLLSAAIVFVLAALVILSPPRNEPV